MATTDLVASATQAADRKVGHENGSLSFLKLIAIVWAKRLVLIACTFIVSGLGVAYAIFSEKQYQASTILLSASATSASSNLFSSAISQLGGLGAFVSGAKDPDVEEALAVLRSRAFLRAFIEKYNLMPVLFPRSAAVLPGAAPTLARGSRKLQKIVEITQDKKSGLIRLQVTWADRNLAAEIANNLVIELNLEMRGRALRRANDSLVFLQQELEKTAEVPTREAINRLVEGAIKQRMLVNITQEFSLKVVDRATAPEATEFVSPKRGLVVFCAAIIGLFLGLASIVGPVALWTWLGESDHRRGLSIELVRRVWLRITQM